MKQNYFALKVFSASVVFSLLMHVSAQAQCTGGTSGGALSPVPSSSYQTMSIASGYKYYTFVVAAATCYPTYDFSFCSTEGGSASFDTQITILDNSGNTVSGGYSDDVCGTQSHLTWTPTAAGTYRVLISKFSCGTTGATSTLAYKYTVSPNMTYSSATTAQASTSTLTRCDVNQPILQIQVVTATGTCTPLSLTQIQFSMAGTSPTTDVSLAHIYYTGTSSTFAATSAFDGAGTTPASGTITVNGSQALAQGTNYFWIAYDMNATGTAGNTVDALVPSSPATAITVGGTVRTVTANNPAGNRTITTCPVAPGGVSTGLTVWLKADAGITAPGGTNVTGWSDQSPSATTTTINGSPDYTASGYNYNPYVNFTLSSSTGGDYIHTPDLWLQSFFVAAQLQDLTRKSTHMFTYNDVTTSLPCSGCAIHGGENGTSAAEYGELGYGQANFQGAGVWRKNGDPNGTAYNTAHTGKFDIVTALAAGTGAANRILGGQTNLSPTFDGRTRDWLGPVGEIIAYTGSVSTTQANKVESYLAIKYGITLGGNGSTTLAYTSPLGTTLWSANTGYHYDVMGIGKDVAWEALSQSKSHSINTPVDLVTFANSNFATPTALTNDGDYLISGHNNGSLAAPIQGTFVHNGPTTTFDEQLSRVWRTQKTGSPAGNVIMEFDMSLVNGPTGYGTNANADIRLLVDDDANFGNGSTGEHTYSPNGGYAATGGKIYFTVPYSDIQSGTGYYTLGSVNSLTASLPIELVDFKAACLGDKVKVSWTTASETDNKYFTVERYTGAGAYLPIANVNGAGTSLVAHSYSAMDNEPLDAENYYRLKQTDVNGAFKYSALAQVDCRSGVNGPGVHHIYPNPTSGKLNYEIVSDVNASAQIKVIDPLGRVVYSEIKSIAAGNNPFELNLEELAKTIYTLHIVIGDNQYSSTTRIIKN